MERQKNSKGIGILVVVAFIMVTGWGVNRGWTADIKYPTKPIEIIIGYQPGSTDVVIKPFSDKMAEYLRQPFMFVYKPGASGAIAGSFVAKAKRDGYTLIGSSNSPVMLAPLTKEGLDYTMDDFAPICKLAGSPLLLAVKGNSPWKTLKDVVEAAKKSPGNLTYSTSGVLGITHISMEVFVKAAGIELTHVPCQGTAPAVTALLGGHVGMTCSTLPSTSPHFKSGALRPIAVFEKGRLKEYPNMPSFSESYPGVAISGWHGLLAPKGTPEQVIRTLYSACKKVIEDDKRSIESQLEKMSIGMDFLGPEEYAKEMKMEYDAMKIIVKDLMKSLK